MKTLGSVLLWCAAVFGGQAAFAQAFPARPVTIVVPYPPGGLIDLVARQIQARYQQELGQPVVIENRSGAGGNVGAEVVARAARTATRCCSPTHRSRSARSSTRSST